MAKSKSTNDISGKSTQSEPPTRRPKRKDKLSLTTSSKDYGGNLTLPDQISQREHETTGQFFRRLDRLVAKAKAEASIESRFDMNLSGKQQAPVIDKTKVALSKQPPKAARNFKRPGRGGTKFRHGKSGRGKESRGGVTKTKPQKRFKRRGK